MIIKNGREVVGINKGTTPINRIYKGESIIWESPNSYSFDANGHDFVDMGEAGIWATCNVGANSPEEAGLYFQWGEIVGYPNASGEKKFTWEDYKFSIDGSNSNFSKYNNTDGLTELELEDDAARANMGGDWRMPTQEEFQKLIDLCSIARTSSYFTLTLRTNKYQQLYIPFAGICRDGSCITNPPTVYYLSSSLTPNYIDNVYLLYATSSICTIGSRQRYLGCSVRGFIPNS